VQVAAGLAETARLDHGELHLEQAKPRRRFEAPRCGDSAPAPPSSASAPRGPASRSRSASASGARAPRTRASTAGPPGGIDRFPGSGAASGRGRFRQGRGDVGSVCP
jgi:hypothetical protein